MQRINPEIKEQFAKIYAKTVDQETSERLTKLITTGIEGYAEIKEEVVLRRVDEYLKQQEIINKRNS